MFRNTYHQDDSWQNMEIRFNDLKQRGGSGCGGRVGRGFGGGGGEWEDSAKRNSKKGSRQNGNGGMIHMGKRGGYRRN